MIEIKGLTKVYRLSKRQMQQMKTKKNIKRAVDGISLTAKEGEIYGLLGPNVPRYEQETGSLFRHLQLWRELYT